MPDMNRQDIENAPETPETPEPTVKSVMEDFFKEERPKNPEYDEFEDEESQVSPGQLATLHLLDDDLVPRVSRTHNGEWRAIDDDRRWTDEQVAQVNRVVAMPIEDLLELRSTIELLRDSYEEMERQRADMERKFEVVGVYLVAVSRRLSGGQPIYIKREEFSEAMEWDLQVDFQHAKDTSVATIVVSEGTTAPDDLETIRERMKQDPLTPMYDPELPVFMTPTKEQMTEAILAIVENGGSIGLAQEEEEKTP